MTLMNSFNYIFLMNISLALKMNLYTNLSVLLVLRLTENMVAMYFSVCGF